MNIFVLKSVSHTNCRVMGRKTEYGSLRLKKETLGRLRELRKAYEECYGRTFTYDAFVRQMMASVEEGDPAVWEAYCRHDMERDVRSGRLELD